MRGRPVARASTRLSSQSSLGLVVFALFFSIYLVSYSGAFLSTDERALFAAAEGLAKRATPTANPLFWSDTGVVRVNAEGDTCANFEPAHVALAAPLIWLARHLPQVGMVHAAFLLNALVTAGTVLVLFRYLAALGNRISTSLVTAGLFGIATLALPYAKTFFREPLSALALLTGAYFLLRMGRSAKPGAAAMAGIALGVALATKQSNALALAAMAPFGLVYLWQSSRSPAVWMRLALIVIVAFSLVAVPALIYQEGCGRPQASIDTVAQPPGDSPFAQALAGFLVSPGKSLFVYAPVLLSALMGFPLSWRQRWRETALCAAVAAVYLVGYAALKPSFWWGGLNWGPRFLVPIVPFLCVPLAPVVAWVTARPRSLWSILFAVLVLLSLAVQLVGVSVPGLAYSRSITQLQPDGMWTLALYNPFYSQPLYSLQLIDLSSLDFAWVHAYGEQVSVDWLFLLVAACTIGLAALALWAARNHNLPRWVGAGLLVASLVAAGLLLVHRYEDPRFPGGSDYHALVEDLAQDSAAEDVMVLANSHYTDFFLNYNKAALNWYALDRANEELPADSQALFERLIPSYDHLWLVTDQTPALSWLSPEEAWLGARLYPLQDRDYSDYCRLSLFSSLDLPDPVRPAVTLDLHLGDRIQLVGYDLPNRSLQPGDAFRLSLLWQAQEQIDEDLTAFVQLLGQDGQVVWQEDQQPVRGQRPTSTWEPGERIRDHYGWIVPASLPPNSYHLIAGLYQWKTMTRWPVTDNAGQMLGDFVDLGTILVVAPTANESPSPAQGVSPGPDLDKG